MRRNLVGLILVLIFALGGCSRADYEALNVEQITYMRVIFDPPGYEVFVMTPGCAVKHYDFTMYWMDNAYDYFSDSLPPADQYTLSEEKISEVSWDTMVEVLSENEFRDLPEKVEIKEGDDFPVFYIEAIVDGETHKSGGYGAGYGEDRTNKKFRNIMDGIEEQLGTK